MNNTFHFALLSFILCPLMALPAFGRREGRNTQVQEERIIELPSVNVQSTPEQNDEQDSVVVQVSGRVRLVGTSLFPELVISGPDMEWYIDGDEAYKLTDLQHRTVTVKGTETLLQLTWASGRPAGERRMLNNIVIIDVE